MRKMFVLFCLLLAASCVKEPQESSTTGTARAPHSGPVRIGFSMDTLKEERWQRDKRLVEQRAKEVGAVLDVQVANGDDAVQTKQADNMLPKGQMTVLKPAIDRKDIKIISEQFAREWKAEEALRITEDALTRTGNKIHAIVASNDGTAGGAISALDAAGLAGKVLVTGQDAQRDAVQRIVKGTQTMTIYKPIQPLAFGAVDAAIKLAHKQPVSAPEKINNGRKDVPAILLEPIVVDKSNVDATVIKDGYQKREDVYGH